MGLWNADGENKNKSLFTWLKSRALKCNIWTAAFNRSVPLTIYSVHSWCSIEILSTNPPLNTKFATFLLHISMKIWVFFNMQISLYSYSNSYTTYSNYVKCNYLYWQSVLGRCYLEISSMVAISFSVAGHRTEHQELIVSSNATISKGIDCCHEEGSGYWNVLSNIWMALSFPRSSNCAPEIPFGGNFWLQRWRTYLTMAVSGCQETLQLENRTDFPLNVRSALQFELSIKWRGYLPKQHRDGLKHTTSTLKI